MEAKEPRWKAKASATTGRGQIFMVTTLGSHGGDLSLIPVAARGGGGMVIEGEKGWPWADESGKLGIDLRGN